MDNNYDQTIREIAKRLQQTNDAREAEKLAAQLLAIAQERKRTRHVSRSGVRRQLEHVENHSAVKGHNKGRAIVSVAFPRDDFEIVDEYADRVGMKLSEFIRRAAVERARFRGGPMSLLTVSGSQGYFVISGVPVPTDASLGINPDTDKSWESKSEKIKVLTPA